MLHLRGGGRDEWPCLIWEFLVSSVGIVKWIMSNGFNIWLLISKSIFVLRTSFLRTHQMTYVCFLHRVLHLICNSVQAAEKEALLVRQEEERTEQRRKAKADKKAQKKSHKTNRTGDKRKAEDVDDDEWGEETGKDCKIMQFRINHCYFKLVYQFIHLHTFVPDLSRAQEA